jgi:hypothetical protein
MAPGLIFAGFKGQSKIPEYTYKSALSGSFED